MHDLDTPHWNIDSVKYASDQKYDATFANLTFEGHKHLLMDQNEIFILNVPKKKLSFPTNYFSQILLWRPNFYRHTQMDRENRTEALLWSKMATF